jgi:hypothetical protein
MRCDMFSCGTGVTVCPFQHGQERHVQRSFVSDETQLLECVLQCSAAAVVPFHGLKLGFWCYWPVWALHYGTCVVVAFLCVQLEPVHGWLFQPPLCSARWWCWPVLMSQLCSLRVRLGFLACVTTASVPSTAGLFVTQLLEVSSSRGAIQHCLGSFQHICNICCNDVLQRARDEVCTKIAGTKISCSTVQRFAT